jgi:hypothetical protein
MKRPPYTTVRPAQTDAEIRAMPDAQLASYIRAGESYRDHTPGHARVDLDRRLTVARMERQRRAALAPDPPPPLTPAPSV